MRIETQKTEYENGMKIELFAFCSLLLLNVLWLSISFSEIYIHCLFVPVLVITVQKTIIISSAMCSEAELGNEKLGSATQIDRLQRNI